jgi:hypothetical protein
LKAPRGHGHLNQRTKMSSPKTYPIPADTATKAINEVGADIMIWSTRRKKAVILTVTPKSVRRDRKTPVHVASSRQLQFFRRASKSAAVEGNFGPFNTG